MSKIRGQAPFNARYMPGIQGAGEITEVWGAAGAGIGYQNNASVSIVKANGNPAIASGTASWSVSQVATSGVFDLHVSNAGVMPQDYFTL